MRLLDSSTITLKEFAADNIPLYAILSHTWGAGEVSYQDIQDPTGRAKQMEGYNKIQNACALARKSGYQYVWVDTCCINKESSAELSEAINSMYQYYRNAEVCYGYLVDVPSDEDPSAKVSAFRKSRWFTRGWTLQELLAPLTFIFFAQDWVEIGTKSSLREAISDVTGIDSRVLLVNHAGEISIAKRMSWAAKRQTTRVEDLAYCLMGLFGINMPTLYGEGANAFIRLQQEIIKSSDDQSIFAWKATSPDAQSRGPLARSPSEFIDSGDICILDSDQKSPYSMTNNGLQIRVPLVPVPGQAFMMAVLNCRDESGNEALGIFLQQEKGQQYTRVRPDLVRILPKAAMSSSERVEVFIKERDPSRFDVSQWMRPYTNYVFTVRKLPSDYGFSIVGRHPLEYRDNPKEYWDCLRLHMSSSGTSGALMFHNSTSGEVFAVVLGVHNYSVWSDVVTDIEGRTAKEIRDSYYKDGVSGTTLWHNLDRVMKPLNGGRFVSVAVRKVQASSQSQYVVDIEITRNNFRGVEKKKEPRPAYTYLVKSTIAPGTGFGLSEYYPPEFWRKEGENIRFSLGGSGTSGILIFQNANTREKFAVMLGIHNYAPWMDLVTNFGNESAQSIRDSYYRDGGRGAKLWDHLLSVSANLRNGRKVNATYTRSYLGEIERTEIIVQ